MKLESPEPIIEAHEKKIREYLAKTFGKKKIRKDAMKQYVKAFTHNSFKTEALGYDIPVEVETYQRLEFFGDSIIEFVVCEHIFSVTEKDQGYMTKYKTEKVSNKYISEKVKENCDFDDLILTGNSFSKETIPDNMRADVFEAMVAVTFMFYGMEEAKRIVTEVLELEGEE